MSARRSCCMMVTARPEVLISVWKLGINSCAPAAVHRVVHSAMDVGYHGLNTQHSKLLM
jgi:hypothetical protein